ncbi:MAG: AAA family ATPase [Saprospiraceae bacterium]
MIKNITLEHFFSFQDRLSIRLNNDVNILMGVNGTGKSNFIKAIRLLYESVVGEGMEELLNRKWSGFENIVNFSNPDTQEISLTFEFDKDVLKKSLNGSSFLFRSNPFYQIKIRRLGSLGDYSISERLWSENAKSEKAPFTYLKKEDAKAVVSERGDNEIKLSRLDVLNPKELLLRQLSDPERYYPIFTLKKAVSQIIVYDYFDTTPSSPVRGLSPYFSEQKLLPDGKNLTSLLSHISGNQVRVYDKIIEELKLVNAQVRELVFTTPRAGSTLLSLKEYGLDKAITVEHISDGTLRFLLHLAIFYNSNRGGVICIDEPETGLHPDMIHTIAKGIKYAAQDGTQMIIATHSPLLLNDFELEDCLIFEKDKNNQTRVLSKSIDDFKDWQGDSLTGQLWLSGKIGGVRW